MLLVYILFVSNKDSNQIRTEPVQSTVDESKKPKPGSNEQSQSKPKVEKKELFATKQPTNDDLQNDIDLKPLITPQSSSNQSTDTTTSPVQSAHYSQPLDFQRIQLNRYLTAVYSNIPIESWFK